MNMRLKVTEVSPGGSAEAAGILVDDVLDQFAGFELKSSGALSTAIGANKSGASMVLYRDGEQVNLHLPTGRLGVVVIEVDFDPESYFAERDLYRRLGEMVITTTPSIEGYRIAKTIDVISAECVFGLHVFSDFFTSMTDFFGGRSKTAQNSLRQARRNCLDELKKEAVSLGANAVVGVDLDYSEFSGQGKSMLFLVASGTAVVIEKT